MPIDQSVRAVNLLPPDFSGAPKASSDKGARPEATGGAGPVIVLGALAAAVAGVAGYVLTENTVKQRTTDLAAVSAQQQALAGKTAQLKPFADFASLANQRVATVRDLAGQRFDWEQSLTDLSRAIPQDVALKSIQGSVTGDSSAGSAAATPGATAAPAPTLTLSGCAPGQVQVARLMARLRDVDGVTRVRLSNSDESTTSAAPTTGPALTRRLAAPCGAGAVSTFQVVMYFENSSAGTAGGTAAATATPAAGGTATATATPAAGGTAAATATPAAGGTAAATATPAATTAGTTTTASTSPGEATP
jgi:Tfp pilus assembly protein PilN